MSCSSHICLPPSREHPSGPSLLALRDSNGGLGSTLPGASTTLTRIVTELLDYLSVEELLTSADETSVVYRGAAKFGGEGRAAPSLPSAQTLTSPGGQELSWLDNMVAFRLTVPRRSPGVAFDTTGLDRPELADLQALNALLRNMADAPGAQVSDAPGSDFRLELLIRTVRLAYRRNASSPRASGADGWLEPDPNFKAVVFEFPRLAFVLEQQGAPGNLDLTLRSWDAAGLRRPRRRGHGALLHADTAAVPAQLAPGRASGSSGWWPTSATTSRRPRSSSSSASGTISTVSGCR